MLSLHKLIWRTQTSQTYVHVCPNTTTFLYPPVFSFPKPPPFVLCVSDSASYQTGRFVFYDYLFVGRQFCPCLRARITLPPFPLDHFKVAPAQPFHLFPCLPLPVATRLALYFVAVSFVKKWEEPESLQIYDGLSPTCQKVSGRASYESRVNCSL